MSDATTKPETQEGARRHFDKDQVLLVLPGTEGGWTIRVTRNPAQQYTARAELENLALTVGPGFSYDQVLADLYLRLEGLKRVLAWLRLAGAAAATVAGAVCGVPGCSSQRQPGKPFCAVCGTCATCGGPCLPHLTGLCWMCWQAGNPIKGEA